MMKKSIFIILFSCTSLISWSQAKEQLKEIANELNTFQTYRTTCEFSYSIPFGDTLTVESLIVIRKVPEDKLCGFYYDFETGESYRGEKFSDFSMYFDSTVYTSYKGVVKKTGYSESPSQFIDLKLKGGFVPAIQRRSSFFHITPYEFAKMIENIVHDNTMNISHKPDTLINQDTCLRFLIESGNTNTHTNFSAASKGENKLTVELCFDKSAFYPVYYKKEFLTSFVNSLEIALFRDTEINFNLKEDYFTEKNLLPAGWDKPERTPEKEKTDPTVLPGKKAPEWSLPVLGKNEIYSSESIKGKCTLLEFTATWCGHCWEAAKMMNRLEDTFKNAEHIELISIYSSDQDNQKSIKRFVKKLNPKSTILYDASAVGKKYFVYGYPAFFIISPRGKIIKVIPGYGPTVEQDIIDELFKFTE